MWAKVAILRGFGAKVGKGLIIKPRVTIKYPWKLSLGNHVWIGENVWIDNLDEVTIGNHVCISQGALLLCGNHDYKKFAFNLITKPIVLEDGVWIGAQSTVAPGVTCRDHSILALRSTATQDLASRTIYQGNPAVAKKQRNIFD
jgi:putative colanic acid biosynthesis acetyltransferase WcaF